MLSFLSISSDAFSTLMFDFCGGCVFIEQQLYAVDESKCQSNSGAAQPCAEEYDARLKGGLPSWVVFLPGSITISSC